MSRDNHLSLKLSDAELDQLDHLARKLSRRGLRVARPAAMRWAICAALTCFDQAVALDEDHCANQLDATDDGGPS